MSAQGEPGPVDPLPDPQPDPQPDPPPDPRADRLRWLARGVVFAIGLWFVADGLSGIWSGGATAARVMIAVAVVLGVAFSVVGLLYLARRGREG